MERALKLIDISYENIFSNLNKKEKAQVIDYLIVKYNFLDYEALINLYGSFERAITAIDSNAGAEYDLEDDTGDHSCYMKMISITRQLFPNIWKLNVEKLSDLQKNQLTAAIKANIVVKEDNIRKFLHL